MINVIKELLSTFLRYHLMMVIVSVLSNRSDERSVFWQTGEGRYLYLFNMEDNHIKSSIKTIERKMEKDADGSFLDISYKQWLTLFKDELNLRLAKEYVEKYPISDVFKKIEYKHIDKVLDALTFLKDDKLEESIGALTLDEVEDESTLEAIELFALRTLFENNQCSRIFDTVINDNEKGIVLIYDIDGIPDKLGIIDVINKESHDAKAIEGIVSKVYMAEDLPFLPLKEEQVEEQSLIDLIRKWSENQ